jgi:transcriptional regulator with XRE-family HTH domain
MPGHRNFKELRDKLADEVGEDRLRAREAETLRLAEVRRARALTQTQLAQALGVSQAQVSRIEKQSDLYLSTLASYIEAMGGELQLVAAFGDERVHLDIGEPKAEPEPETVPAKVPDLMAALEAALARLADERTAVPSWEDAVLSMGSEQLHALSMAIFSGAITAEIASELGVSTDEAQSAMEGGLAELAANVQSMGTRDRDALRKVMAAAREARGNLVDVEQS